MKPFCDTGHAVPIQQWKTSMLVLLHPTNVYLCKRLGFPINNCVYCQHSIIASPPRALLRVYISPLSPTTTTAPSIATTKCLSLPVPSIDSCQESRLPWHHHSTLREASSWYLFALCHRHLRVLAPMPFDCWNCRYWSIPKRQR